MDNCGMNVKIVYFYHDFCYALSYSICQRQEQIWVWEVFIWRPDENAEVEEQLTRTEQSTETVSEQRWATRGQTLGWRRRVPTAEWTHLGLSAVVCVSGGADWQVTVTRAYVIPQSELTDAECDNWQSNLSPVICPSCWRRSEQHYWPHRQNQRPISRWVDLELTSWHGIIVKSSFS